MAPLTALSSDGCTPRRIIRADTRRRRDRRSPGFRIAAFRCPICFSGVATPEEEEEEEEEESQQQHQRHAYTRLYSTVYTHAHGA